MITRLNISPAALKTVSTSAGRAIKKEHRQLLDKMRAHGAIVLESDEAAQELVRFLKQQDDALPPGVRHWWRELATEFRKASRMTVVKPALNISPATAQEFSSLSRAWAEEIDVAVVDPHTAETLGVSEDEGQKISPDTGFEVVISDVATSSYHFDAIEKLVAQGSLRKGERRDNFWDDVLEPLASVSSNAVVLDWYLLSGWLEKGWQDEHVQWLTRRLAHGRGPVGKLTLIGQDFTPNESAFERMCTTLESIASEGRLHSIELALIPPGRWRPRHFPHDRHIRFDSGGIMPLAGFDRLSQPVITREEGMNWKFLSSSNSRALEEAERSARQGARITTIELVHH